MLKSMVGACDRNPGFKDSTWIPERFRAEFEPLRILSFKDSGVIGILNNLDSASLRILKL